METQEKSLVDFEKQATSLLMAQAPELAAMRETLDAMTVSTPEEAAQLTDLAKKIKTRMNVLDAKRKEATAPLRAMTEDINALFNPTINGLERALHTAKVKLTEYQREQKRLAEEARARELEELAKQEEEANKQAEQLRHYGADTEADALKKGIDKKLNRIAKPVKTGSQRGSEGSAHLITRWEAEVVDFKALIQAVLNGDMPENCLDVDFSALRDLARLGKEECTRHGVKFYKDVSTAIR